MTYTTIKWIKGNPYLYEVRSEREGDRVRQVFVRYLGRVDTAEGRERQATYSGEIPVRVEPERVTPETTPEIVSTPEIAKDYVIKQEPEPLLPSGFKYMVYQSDDTPMYISGSTPEEAESKLKQGHKVASLMFEEQLEESEAVTTPVIEEAQPRTGQQMCEIRDRLQGERMGWQVPQEEAIRIESEVSGQPITPLFSESMIDTHKNLVRKAILEGEDVPPEVLKDYPDLTPVIEEAQKEPWEMTRKEFKIKDYAPKIEAIQQAIQEGKPIIVSTHLRATQLTKPEHIRLSGATVQIPQGSKWVALTDDQVQTLAGQAGIKPVPFEEKIYHHAEVEKAIAEGKSIPLEVLKDYPELTETITEKTSETLSEEIPAIEATQELPIASETVSGLKVRHEIPNQESIESSLEDYEILPGIREIPTSETGEITQPKFYSATEEQRTKELAEEIKSSGEINPLIVVLTDTGDYILKGGHRLDALRILGVKSFPAQVVIDRSLVPEGIPHIKGIAPEVPTPPVTPEPEKEELIPAYRVDIKEKAVFKPNEQGGIWFTDKETAQSLLDMSYEEQKATQKVHEVLLDIKNPYRTHTGESAFLTKERIEELKKQGYDAVVSEAETIVFDSSQVIRPTPPVKPEPEKEEI